MPMFCTASGMVILANRPDTEVEAILAASDFRRLTEWTITDPDKVRKRIELARRDGYCVSVQQSMPHEISTAAPVLDSEGRAFAAVQVPVYMPEWTTEMVAERVVPFVIETARAISGSYFSEK